MTDQLIIELQQYGHTGINVLNAETRLGDVKRNYSDTSKAKIKLGWQPQTDLMNGLRKTVEYFCNEKI